MVKGGEVAVAAAAPMRRPSANQERQERGDGASAESGSSTLARYTRGRLGSDWRRIFRDARGQLCNARHRVLVVDSFFVHSI